MKRNHERPDKNCSIILLKQYHVNIKKLYIFKSLKEFILNFKKYKKVG